MLFVSFFGKLQKFSTLDFELIKNMEKMLDTWKFKVKLVALLEIAGRQTCYFVFNGVCKGHSY